MRLAIILLLWLLLWAAPAAADESIFVMPDRCAPLAAYVPADDVAFQPGADAYGRAVVPADLDYGTPPVIAAEDVEIDIEVPIARADRDWDWPPDRDFDHWLRDSEFDATAEIGTVTLGEGGSVEFDGVTIGPGAVLPPGCE